MNAIKKFQIAATIALVMIVSILAGCSDQITSSGEPLVKAPKVPGEYSDQKALPVFHTLIRLKPLRSITYNYSNTGLAKFTSINIINQSSGGNSETANNSCEDLKIFSNSVSSKNTQYLDCQSAKLDLKEITIQNTSTKFIELDVSIFGEVRVKSPAEGE